ncbi:MAG: PD-(D/E)XK nuclease family protein [Bacteroidaceae bacterium]|nr:PD-(D/E)XK nuclease family protein [Bacteroidaceae bacterium]
MTFLEHVAKDILTKYGNNLKDIAIVFPNKRASLFLNEALAENSTKPVLTPEYFTISELFAKYSSYQIGDTLMMVSILYNTYIQITHKNETLDHFFPWGELMINDFDDIDKHLVDAEKLFTNVKDLHQLDDIQYLTDDQKKTLSQFFPDFDSNNTRLKDIFLQLWSKLAEIYQSFNNSIREHGILYEGAMYREVVSNMSTLCKTDKTFLFVGFNHLLPVEQALFQHMKDEGKGRFYWDYDDSYMDGDEEAGFEIKKNLILFPNELEGQNIYDNLRQHKDISFISSVTNNLQARHINQWLDTEKIKAGRKTVIVLADESLLPAVLHSIPKDVGKINITIGYSLAYTEIPTIIYHLCQNRDFIKLPTLNEKINYLIDGIENLLKEDTDDALFKESLFRTYTLLNRLSDLYCNGFLNITEITFRKLLKQLLNSTSVPFHGQPLEGIQIMGVLETRNLDFEHVLLLSCNEDILPKNSLGTSFIPHFLRKAYGLSSQDIKINTYAYYFYHLLQRSKDICITWNKSTEGVMKGKMSRFMLQMLTARDDIRQYTFHTSQNLCTSTAEDIEKTPEMLEQLKDMEFSATRLSTYLHCQKEFYYRYVAKLKEYEDIEELEHDNRIFGIIFHDSVRKLYDNLIGREITRKALEDINDDHRIRQIVTDTYKQEIQQRLNLPDISIDGLKKIHINVITKFIHQLIDIDIKLVPFTIISLEKEYKDDSLGMKGIIDRLDIVRHEGRNIIRVVDFKTGGSAFKPKLSCVEDIFDPNRTADRSSYYLQTFLYSIIIDNQKSNILKDYPDIDATISPALLFIQHAGADDYNPILSFNDMMPILDISKYKKEFIVLLQSLIQQVQSSGLFEAKKKEDSHCSLCPFRLLCRA